MSTSAVEADIDDARYSRQIYVIGRDAMRNLSKAAVGVVGLSGVGVELSKDLALAGVNHLILWDSRPVTTAELSANFFAQPSDVGAPRVQVAAPALRELNPQCHVESVDDVEEILSASDVLVIADLIPQLDTLAAKCRAMGKKLVVATSVGLAARCFCDFGEKFVTMDATGEDPSFSVIVGVDEIAAGTAAEEGKHRVLVTTDEPHGLGDGDRVRITDIHGDGPLADCLNGTERDIQVMSSTSFVVPLSETDEQRLNGTEFHYLRGGYAQQLKQPREFEFRPWAEAVRDINAAGVSLTNYAMDRLSVTHEAFRLLDRRQAAGEPFPAPWCSADADVFANAVQAAQGELSSAQRDYVRLFASTASGLLSPLCAIVGGFAAQQVMIALTGRFTPLCQWCFWDAVDLFRAQFPERELGSATHPLSASLTSEETVVPSDLAGGRAAGQAIVMGRRFCEVAASGRWFLVGAGALGCEYLKHFACTGVGTGTGSVVVVDVDSIETSNLSRQFLFRNSDVGRPKSECAARAACRLNPALHIDSMTEKVGHETEHIMNSAFYAALQGEMLPYGAGRKMAQGGVVNALDNVPTRLYMDERCVMYSLPLVEAGTLGSKANTQIVVPYLTESYGATADATDSNDMIPFCTLHLYPAKIDHTIMWARDLFQGLFHKPVEALQTFARSSSADEWIAALNQDPAEAPSQAVLVRDCLTPVADGGARPANSYDCAVWARNQFEDLFNWRMRDLLHQFPLDSVNDQGLPFWSGAKRPPVPAVFSTSNTEHTTFVDAAARLWANVWGIDYEPVPLEQIAAITVREWRPRDDKAADYRAVAMTLAPVIADSALRAALPRTPLEFEKDDDSNHHVAFVTAASNTRALCYSIEPASFAETKRIAGRIVPAMITTTALIVGYGGIEQLKLIGERTALLRGMQPLPDAKRLEYFCNTFVNIGLALFSPAEPSAPKSTPLFDDPELCADASHDGAPVSFSYWTQLIMHAPRDVTVKAVHDWVTSIFKGHVVLGSIASGTKCLWGDYFDQARSEHRLGLSVLEALAEVGISVPPDTPSVELLASGEGQGDYVPAAIPLVRVVFDQ